MRKSLHRRSIFLMLAIMLSCVHAATDSVDQRFDGYLDRMAQLIEQGDYEAARDVLTEVREFLFDETMPWTLEAGQRLNAMAAYAIEIESYWMAEFIIDAAISRQEKAGGMDHPDLAVSLTLLGECAGYKRHVMLTQLYLRKALSIREIAWGVDHPGLSDSIRNLSWALSEEHQSEELLALRHRNLALHEKAHGINSRHLMLPLFDLGTTYSALQQYDNSLAQYRRIGELAVIDDVELTAEQQELHEFSRHNMAFVHGKMGEHDKSVQIYRSLLDEHISHYGKQQPELIHVMKQLAASLHKSGNHDEAERLYTDALAILEEQESVRHHELYSSLDNLAEILIDQGRFEQAEPMLNRSLRLKREYMGTNHDVVSQHIDRMIRFHEQAGQPEKADALRTR